MTDFKVFITGKLPEPGFHYFAYVRLHNRWAEVEIGARLHVLSADYRNDGHELNFRLKESLALLVYLNNFFQFD